MAGCCSVSARVVLMLLGLVFWACSAGMIFLAVKIFEYIGPIKDIYNDYYLAVPAGVLIGLAILLLLVGLIGCLVACKENRCLQITFFTLLLFIVLIEITGAVLSIIYKEEVSHAIENGMNNAINSYSDDDIKVKDSWDYMQTQLHCCGVYNYTDWAKTEWGKKVVNVGKVPESCCKQNDDCTGAIIELDKINKQGCHNVLYADVRMYLAWIIGVAILFALVQMIGLVCTCVRLWSKRKDSSYQVLDSKPADTSGYRA